MPEIQRRKKDSARIVWDTKPRRATNPKDIDFQTAEIVIPNPKYKDELPLSFKNGLFDDEIDRQKMNRLIWGDNLLAMQALLAQGYEGKINLIYIDPPFDSKADYSHKMTITPSVIPASSSVIPASSSVIPASSSVIPAKAGIQQLESLEFTKEPSVIERLAYKDTWAGGTDSYLDMLYPRLQLMKRLLAEDGSIYVHCDWHANSYVRILLDEIFGKGNFLNEIIWAYRRWSASSKSFQNSHDYILWYSKAEDYIWNQPYEEYADKGAHYTEEDEKGKFRWQYLNGEKYKLYMKEGTRMKDWWDDIAYINSMAKERVAFDTQKPKALLERIIKASSNEGDLVADFFAGSGTTLAVAEKLGRRWLGCELGKVGIQVTRSRLVGGMSKPFLIENIGNYQREMIYLTGGRIWEMQILILKLYGATPRDKVSGLGD